MEQLVNLNDNEKNRQRSVSHSLTSGSAETAPLLHYLEIVGTYKWQITAAMLVGLLASYAVSRRMQPVYEAVAMLEIDRDSPSGLIGNQAERRIYTGDDDVYVASQIKLIQSDPVLRPVAVKFSLVENTISGGHLSSAPMEWKQLKVSRQPNTNLIQIRYRSTDPVLAADVANAIANSYIDHSYSSKLNSSARMTRYAERQLAEFKTKMDESKQALGKLERELNLVNAQEKTSLVSARLIQLNNEYTRAQVNRVSRESAYNMAKTKNLDAAQASTISDPLRKLIERRDEAREKFSQTKEHLGVEHPEYRRQSAQLAELDRQVEGTRQSIAARLELLYQESVDTERMLANSLASTKAESDRLNVRSFAYEELKRETETDEKVYAQLAQKVKETGINASFRNESIRAADPARPPVVPVSPNLGFNLMAGLLISSVLATGAAVLRDKTNNTVRNRAQAESMLKIPTVGSLPTMPRQKRSMGNRSKLTISSSDHASSELLPVTDRNGDNIYAEALRSLNNTIMLRTESIPMRTLLVTSSVAAEGKTTIGLHLAIVNSLRNRRTLLIDGDVRRPTLHRILDLANSAGVADFVAGDSNWRAAVVKHRSVNTLDILPAGQITQAALDMVGDRFRLLLDQAAEEYDLVIVDSPPILCCAETLAIAAGADRVLFVVSAGKTERKAIQASLGILASARATVVGVVLNGVKAEDCDISQYASYHIDTPARMRARL